jgi:uncharacterized protein (TIGR04222 family)
MEFAELSGPAFLLFYAITFLVLVGFSEVVRNAIVLSLGSNNRVLADLERQQKEAVPSSSKEIDLTESHTRLSDDLAAIARKFGDSTPIREDLDYKPAKALATSQSAPLPGGLIPSEIAYLQEGKQRAFLSALTQLVKSDDLTINSVTSRLESNRSLPSINGILELAIFKAVPKYGATIESVYKSIDSAANELHKTLASKGLLASRQLIKTAQIIQCGFILLLPLFVGIPRLQRGISLQHPVGFLVLFLILSFIAAGFVAFRHRLDRTPTGEKAIRDAEQHAAALKLTNLTAPDRVSPTDAALACAVGFRTTATSLGELRPHQSVAQFRHVNWLQLQQQFVRG